MKSTREELIQMVRNIARERVERAGSVHGQRITSKPVKMSSELVVDLGFKYPGFDPLKDLLSVETRFHNNHGRLIATDHSIFIIRNGAGMYGPLGLQWEFLCFELGEFMEKEFPAKPQIDPKEFVMNLPQSKRVELYKWMHDAFGCRV